MRQQTKAKDDSTELTGLARSLERGAFFDCEFEQLDTNECIIEFPTDMRVADVQTALNGLRDHISITHINAGKVHVETDSETFN